MVDQESPHKGFVLEMAKTVSDLLNEQSRAFLKGKCEEFFRRVEDIDTQWKQVLQECERWAERLGSRWLWKGLMVERQFVLRAPKKWPGVNFEAKVAEFCRRVESVEAQRKNPKDPFNICKQELGLRWNYGLWSEAPEQGKPKFIHVERQFYLEPPSGDPRHWFPPFSVWWKDASPEEELPNEQDTLLRDCVLLVLIHDLTFPRHKPVYFVADCDYPGGNWWHEHLYQRTIQEMAYIPDSDSPDVGHFKDCIRQSLKNVAEACSMQNLRGKGGRKGKHDVEFWRRVQNTHDELADQLGSKGAWNKAAETHGIPSGDAARMQCKRYLSPKTEQ